jgi:hypothetical protein
MHLLNGYKFERQKRERKFYPLNLAVDSAINIKIDSELKVEAQKIAKELGISLSGVIKLYLKQFIG